MHFKSKVLIEMKQTIYQKRDCNLQKNQTFMFEKVVIESAVGKIFQLNLQKKKFRFKLVSNKSLTIKFSMLRKHQFFAFQHEKLSVFIDL